MIEGDAPESRAFKTVYRALKSRQERRTLRDERGLHPDTIKRRANTYEGRFGAVARRANESTRKMTRADGENIPIKMARKNLRGRQAAYVAGGAGVMYAGNKVLRSESNSPTRAITTTADKYSDMTRNKVAGAIDTKEVTKRDNKDRYAAGAVGATAGAAAMPVRESAGGPGKKFAQKYGDLPSGVHEISSKDAMSIAAPGLRRGNKDYTTRMAADIERGWEPEMGRVQITDDGARFTGGQHRADGRAWAQQPTQKVEVVRAKGHMGGTSPGIVAAGKQLKRRLAPKWYAKHDPGSVKELLERDKTVSQAKVDRAQGNATPSHAALDPVLDSKGLKRLHGKQAAIMTGGAGLALGANEYRRSINKAWKPRKVGFHPIRTRVDRAVAERSRLAGENFTQGAADAMKANMPKMNAPDLAGAATKAGAGIGAGIAGGGLLAGAGKVIGDAMQAGATKKAAKEGTKRAQLYAGSGVAGAGMIGTGIAFNRRKQ